MNKTVTKQIKEFFTVSRECDPKTGCYEFKRKFYKETLELINIEDIKR